MNAERRTIKDGLVDVTLRFNNSKRFETENGVFYKFTHNGVEEITDKRYVRFRCQGLMEAIDMINFDEIMSFEITSVDIEP